MKNEIRKSRLHFFIYRICKVIRLWVVFTLKENYFSTDEKFRKQNVFILQGFACEQADFTSIKGL